MNPLKQLVTQRRPRSGLRSAQSYGEWRAAAIAQDEQTGAASWKDEEQTRIYDYAAIRNRLEQLREHRRLGDLHGLLYALNEGIHGNMGNMGSPELYTRAVFGTKRLVTDYIDEICTALVLISNAATRDLPSEEKLDFFRRASLCFGRSALLLSGGGIFGNFHVGVTRALIEQDLLPRVVSGASAGALIAAILGTHVRDDLPAAFEVSQLQFRVEARKPKSERRMVFPRFDIEDIRRHVDRLVPDLTFGEALQRSGLYINISVSPSELHQTPRLMNAITSPNVYVRSAVLASCAIPGIYAPVQMRAKNRHGQPQDYLPGRRWVDGSLSADVPARRLSRLYAVNHYIVSQVNPFALIHRPVQHSASVAEDAQQLVYHSSKNAARMLQSVADKYGRRWPELRQAVNSLSSVWLQDYGGDINILPPAGLIRPWKAMAKTSDAALTEIILAGERATWPRIEMIRNSTKVGRVLDEILLRLDAGGPALQHDLLRRLT